MQNAAEISAKGIKEIVLTGVNIGDYGKGEFGNKKHEHTFLELVQALDEVPDVDQEKVTALQNQIADGTYQMDPNRIASAIMNDLLITQSSSE